MEYVAVEDLLRTYSSGHLVGMSWNNMFPTQSQPCPRRNARPPLIEGSGRVIADDRFPRVPKPDRYFLGERPREGGSERSGSSWRPDVTNERLHNLAHLAESMSA